MLQCLTSCHRWRPQTCVRSTSAVLAFGSRTRGGLFHYTPLARAAASSTSSSTSAASTSTAASSREAADSQDPSTPTTTTTTAAPRAWQSNAPPLRVLSWEVDAMENTHRHWPRRLPFADRLPWIVETIAQCAPDIVALQNSTPALAEALAAPPSLSDSARLTLVHKELLEKFSAPVHQPAEPAPLAHTEARPRYTLIGAAENGRCGQVQLLLRVGSGLEARVLPSGPGVSALLRWAGDDKDPSEASRETGRRPSVPHRGGEHRSHGSSRPPFVVSSVDLSYRGKSIALDGSALTTAEVSMDGSPFTLTTPSADAAAVGSSSGPRSARPHGQMDTHRAAALAFLNRVVQPDVICGNLYMGHDETVPFFDDAWRRAGAPAAQERTTDTRRPTARGMRTNYHYFLPSAAPEARPSRPTRHHPSPPTTESAPVSDESEPTPPLAVGTPLRLEATVDAAHHTWRCPSEAAPVPAVPLTVPEVAGRFQRCLLSSGQATRTHTRHYSFVRRYRACRVVVVKPFVDVPVLTPEEAAWHRTQRLHARRRGLERQRFALERKRHYLLSHPAEGEPTPVEDDAPHSEEAAAETVESVDQRLAELALQMEQVEDTTHTPEVLQTSLAAQFPLVVMLH